MLLDLKKLNFESNYSTELDIETRLPVHVAKAQAILCEYRLKKRANYTLFLLKTSANLQLICQRCLKNYDYRYVNDSELALCDSDIVAEQLLSQYETIVVPDQQLSLTEIVSDELFLFTPESHPDPHECDTEISAFID